MESNGTTGGTVSIWVNAHSIRVYHQSGYFDYPKIMVAYFTPATGWTVINKLLWRVIALQQNEEIQAAMLQLFSTQQQDCIIGKFGIAYSKN